MRDKMYYSPLKNRPDILTRNAGNVIHVRRRCTCAHQNRATMLNDPFGACAECLGNAIKACGGVQ